MRLYAKKWVNQDTAGLPIICFFGKHEKNCVPKCISKCLPLFELFWPPVTFNGLWGQKEMAYDAQRYHTGMHVKIGFSKYISKIWPWFTFIWTLLTSDDLKGQLFIVYDILGYYMNMCWKNCISKYIF